MIVKKNLKRLGLRAALTLAFMVFTTTGAWANDYKDQTTQLAAGWNWISTYVETNLTDLRVALTSSSPVEITILSQNDGDTKYLRNGNRWNGNLTSLDVAQMYMIYVAVDCEITVSGEVIDPSSCPITISEGDNWIAFPLSKEMNVSEAFNGFAINGDMILSQTEFAVYTGDKWRGTLFTLKPGQGYIYKSADSNSRILVFPESQNQADSGNSSSSAESRWPSFNYNAYKMNRPIVAFIQIDGSTISSESNWANLEIAAFVGDECRGHVFMADYTNGDDLYPIVELPVYYDNTGEVVTFMLYDHATGTLYNTCVPNQTIETGEEHLENYNGEYLDIDDLLFINFSFVGLIFADNDTEKPADQKNSYLISDNEGSVKDVILQGRTLYKDGDWNTLCLPFDVEDGDDYDFLTFTGTPLEGATVMELDTEGTYDTDKQTGFDESDATLYLYFKEAESIEAGVPYLIKWDGTYMGDPIVNPVFTGVTIDDTERSVTSADKKVTFKGTYTPMTFTDEDKSILFLGEENTLYYPQPDLTTDPENPKYPSINPFRAYFQLSDGAGVKAFKLSFGEGADGIGEVQGSMFNVQGEESWYELSGRQLSVKPAKKGLYIHQGKKVAIQ